MTLCLLRLASVTHEAVAALHSSVRQVHTCARQSSGMLDGQSYTRIECGQPECTHTSSRRREDHAEAAVDVAGGGTGGSGACRASAGSETSEDRRVNSPL